MRWKSWRKTKKEDKFRKDNMTNTSFRKIKRNWFNLNGKKRWEEKYLEDLTLLGVGESRKEIKHIGRGKKLASYFKIREEKCVTEKGMINLKNIENIAALPC